MEAVNLYIQELTPSSLGIIKKVRAWGTSKVRLWIGSDDLKESETLIRRIIANWRDGRIIDQNVQIDHSIGYYEWNLETVNVDVITSNGLKALIQRCLAQNMQFAILCDSARCKGRMVCFVDAPQRSDLPDLWRRFPCLASYDEVFQFCQRKGVFDFDLTNTSRFCETGKVVQGAAVYKEKVSGNFFYLDNLHKNHYEVFSQMGRHLGEMSLNGNLNREKADLNKHLEL
jgi:hypothetical protein